MKRPIADQVRAAQQYRSKYRIGYHRMADVLTHMDMKTTSYCDKIIYEQEDL